MDYRLAEFVRYVNADELPETVVAESKGETWTQAREFALIVIAEQQRVIVAGGKDGVEFNLNDRGRPTVKVMGVEFEVLELIWHTHPYATGPSDFDCRLLEILDQESSIVHEITGVPGGTIFRQKNRPLSRED